MKPRKTPAPAPSSFEDRFEARYMALQNQLLFAQSTIGELEREIAALRLMVIGEPPREWLTVSEAAEVVGRSTVTIAYWAKTHHLGVFDQRRWKIDRAQLKRYLVDRFGAERLPRGLQA